MRNWLLNIVDWLFPAPSGWEDERCEICDGARGIVGYYDEDDNRYGLCHACAEKIIVKSINADLDTQ